MRIATCKHLRHQRTCSLGMAEDSTIPTACKTCDRYEPMVRGMGDFVAMVAKATGAEAVAKQVERVTGKPCGCGKRREALNRMIPFGPQEPER